MQRRQQRQQFGQRSFSAAHQLLEVVQHQQHTLAGQRLGQRRRATGGGARQGQRAGDGVQHLRRIFTSHQRNESNALKRQRRRCAGFSLPRGWLAQRLRHFNAQAGLAAAPRAQQRDQPARQHQGAQAGRGHVGAEQPRQVGGQCGGSGFWEGSRHWRMAHGRGDGRGRIRGRCRWRWRGRHSGCQRQGQRRVLPALMQPVMHCVMQRVMQRNQALPLHINPLIVVARHQLATVQRQRLGGTATAGQAFKFHRVTGQCAAHGAHNQAVGLQHRSPRHASRFQQALQRRQHLAQPVAAYVQRHAGPQQFNQLFPRVRTVRRQRHPRQQRGHGARRETGYALHAVKHLHRAQQAHLPARLARGRGGGRRGRRHRGHWGSHSGGRGGRCGGGCERRSGRRRGRRRGADAGWGGLIDVLALIAREV